MLTRRQKQLRRKTQSNNVCKLKSNNEYSEWFVEEYYPPEEQLPQITLDFLLRSINSNSKY